MSLPTDDDIRAALGMLPDDEHAAIVDAARAERREHMSEPAYWRAHGRESGKTTRLLYHAARFVRDGRNVRPVALTAAAALRLGQRLRALVIRLGLPMERVLSSSGVPVMDGHYDPDPFPARLSCEWEDSDGGHTIMHVVTPTGLYAGRVCRVCRTFWFGLADDAPPC